MKPARRPQHLECLGRDKGVRTTIAGAAPIDHGGIADLVTANAIVLGLGGKATVRQLL